MIYLHGIGHFHPENVIDNNFLQSLDIGSDDVWILDRVGIRERRTALSLEYIRHSRNVDPRAAQEASAYTGARMAALAADLALRRAGLSIRDIGFVICGGSYPSVASPAEACLVAAELGIDAPAFDLNSACSTFLVQIRNISMWRQDAAPDFTLIVQPERLTRMVNYNDRNTAVLMGDCATAAIVSTRIPSAVTMDHVIQQTSAADWKKVYAKPGEHFQQEGAAVQTFAIRRTCEMLKTLQANVTGEAFFVGHQANRLMLETVCRRGGIADHRHLRNVDTFGNCGAAGGPSVISQKWEWLLKTRATVQTVVVGAGLTWAGAILAFT